MKKKAHRKPLEWLGDSKDVLSSFPDGVKKSLGHGIHLGVPIAAEKETTIFRMTGVQIRSRK